MSSSLFTFTPQRPYTVNRQFHSTTPFGNYVLLAALLSVAIYILWQGLSRQITGIIIAAILVFMLIIIERMIHTCYTITTDGKLIIDKGRLAKVVVLNLKDIKKIDKIRRSSLVVVTFDNKEYYIRPQNEEDFIKCIKKYRS